MPIAFPQQQWLHESASMSRYIQGEHKNLSLITNKFLPGHVET